MRAVLADQVAAANPPPLPRCVHLFPLTGDAGGVLAHTYWEDAGLPAVYAWSDQDNWRTISIESQGLNAGYPVAGTARLRTPGEPPSLLLGTQGPGSGGFGQLVAAHPAAHGTLGTTTLTKLVDHARFDFFGNDLVLQTYRGRSPGRAAWECNACLPVNNQTLYHWDGDHLTAQAERIFPEPCLTATLFLGALRDGDDARAARYVADPKLVARAREMLDIRPGQLLEWRTPDCWTAGGAGLAFWESERTNWDRIPAPYRRTPPTFTFNLTLERGRDKAILHMERRPDNWIITRAIVPAP